MSDEDKPEDVAPERTVDGPGAAGDGGPGDDDGDPRLSSTGAGSSTSDAEEDDEDDEVEYVELVKVHNVQSRGEARIVKGMLEGAQVPCMIEDDAGDSLDVLSGAQLDGIDIFVPAEFAPRARAVLSDAGIAAGLDKRRLDALYEEKVAPAAHGGEAAWKGLAELLEKEARDARHELLARLATQGAGGLECARGLLRVALHEAPKPVPPEDAADGDDDSELPESPLLSDVVLLAEEGRLGRGAPMLISGDLSREARDPTPDVRRRAALALGGLRAAGAGPVLVSLLDDADEDVRDEALESLYRLSNGETFDYDPEVEPAEQEAALVRWREWAKRNPDA